jgi:hypothetical protein
MLLIYKIRQFHVQYEMRLVLNNSATSPEKLILSRDEYYKSRINSNEILFRGNMYDVKSVNISGDMAELLVINDTKEKDLVKNIKDFLNKTNQQKKELPDQLQKFLSLNYLSADKDCIIHFPSFSFNIVHYPYLDFNAITSDTPSPPPKLG